MKTLATSLLGLFLLFGCFVWTGIQRAETHEPGNQLQATQVAQADQAANPESLPRAAATRGVLTPQEGHSGSVTSVAFSPNGRLIVSGGEDRTLRLWDAASGTLIRVFRGHSGPVNSVAFSPDGRLIVSGSSDQTLRLWEVASGALVIEIKATASVTSVGYSRDHILAASTDGILHVRNTDSGETRTFASEGGKTVFAAFSPDGRWIAARAGAGNRLLLWDVASGTLIREINVDASWHGLAFSPDGRLILAGSGPDLQMLDAATGAPIRKFTFVPRSESRIAVGENRGWTISSVEFSPDGQRIMFCGVMFDAATGRPIHAFGNFLINAFTVGEIAFAPAAFSPDGRGIVTGLWSALRLWDVATGASTRKFEGFHYEPSQLSQLTHFAAFSPDGRNIVSAGPAPVRVWDSGSGSLVREFDRDPPALVTLALSPDGRRLVSAPSSSFALHLWDVASGKMIHEITSRVPIKSSAFSPDGQRILVSSSYGEILQLIDATTGSPIIEAHLVSSARSSSIAFSPDGRRILLGGRMLNAASLDRSAVRRMLGGPLFLDDREFRVLAVAAASITAVAFSPDGKRVLTGGADHALRLWDSTSLALERELKGHSDTLTSVAFSPNGQRILSGSKDRTVRLWDAASGALVHAFKDHADAVTSVAFSPDGRRILSAGIDGTWRLRDAASFAPIMTMEVLPGSNWIVELPDGRYRSTDGASRWLAVIDGVTTLPMEPHEKAFRMPARAPNDAR